MFIKCRNSFLTISCSYDIIANEYPNGLPAGEYIIRMVTDDSYFRDDELCIGQTIITVVVAE